MQSVSDHSARLRDIFARSLSPEERRASFPSSTCSVSPEVTAPLLRRWQTLLEGHPNPDLFQHRLWSLNLDHPSALAWLNADVVDVVDGPTELPSWLRFLDSALSLEQFANGELCEQQVEEWAAADHRSGLADAEEESPVFAAFVRPLLAAFSRHLTARCGVSSERFAPTALHPLYGRLARSLSHLAARVLAFDLKRRGRLGELTGATPADRYQHYFDGFRVNPRRYWELFQSFPVLARHLATTCEQFREAAEELVQRLAADRSAIAATFFGGKPLGPVLELHLGLSDPHRAGRTVGLVRFADGLSIIYKPRPMTLDGLFNRLIDWWNEGQFGPSLRPVPYLARADHGWTQFVESRDCRTEAEVRQYFQRQGILTAIIYLLGGEDFHPNNIIPHGEWPVLIDLECLLTPIPPPATGIPLDAPSSYRTLTPSVLTTNMLPIWKAGDAWRVCYMMSGIGGSADREWPKQVPGWSNLGTDQLCLEFSRRHHVMRRCLPRIGGVPVEVDGYLDEVERGFEWGYRALQSQQDSLLVDGGVLDAFRSVELRCVLRETREYRDLLFWSTAPDHLVSGAAHDVALDRLCRGTLRGNQGFLTVDAEKRCLWQRDIPYFIGSSGSGQLVDVRNQTVDASFVGTAFERMRARLRRADMEDLHWQRELLRVSLGIAIERADATPGGQVLEEELPARLLQEAEKIAESLDRLAIRGERGAAWMNLLRVTPEMGLVGPVHAGPWLYDGSAGVALFLANLVAVTGNTEWLELIDQALRFAAGMGEFLLARQQHASSRQAALSGGHSLVYSLVECGRLLGNDRYLDQAVRFARSMPARAGFEHENPDVVEGLAGDILVLLALRRLRPQGWLLDRALEVASRFRERAAEASRHGGWRVPWNAEPLVGVAHGQSGIALALERLYRAAPEPWLHELAVEALDFERALFLPDVGEWHYRKTTTPERVFMGGWCGGAPGIGFARLDLRASIGTSCDEDLERAIDSTRRHLGETPHYLCCGEASRIWFLAEAAVQLGRPELLTLAREGAEGLLRFYQRHGGWQFQGVFERRIVPSLFGGMAGIGMAFVQAADPGRVSRVVTLS